MGLVAFRHGQGLSGTGGLCRNGKCGHVYLYERNSPAWIGNLAKTTLRRAKPHSNSFWRSRFVVGMGIADRRGQQLVTYTRGSFHPANQTNLPCTRSYAISSLKDPSSSP